MSAQQASCRGVTGDGGRGAYGDTRYRIRKYAGCVRGYASGTAEREGGTRKAGKDAGSGVGKGYPDGTRVAGKKVRVAWCHREEGNQAERPQTRGSKEMATTIRRATDKEQAELQKVLKTNEDGGNGWFRVDEHNGPGDLIWSWAEGTGECVITEEDGELWAKETR